MAEEKKDQFAEFRAKLHEGSSIKHVVAVMSGKGGVGKSLVTSLLAVNGQRLGRNIGVLDADITGPSIPHIFGLRGMLYGESDGTIYPMASKTGIKAVSLNLINDDPSEPVVWRGPVIADLVKQFYSNVAWEDIDELYVDMPPGTGDVPLTVFQSLPVSGIIIVTSPQELVSMIVEKAVKMAKMMNIPIIGLVENMAYLNCPHCNEKIYPFGHANQEIAEKYGIPYYAEMAIDPYLAELADTGHIENHKNKDLEEISEAITRLKK